MQLRIETNARQFRRRFRRLKNKSFAFAVKNATDSCGEVMRSAFEKLWLLRMDARRKSFAKNALRVRRALVNPQRGLTVRATRLFSQTWADEILFAQLRGKENRRPKQGQAHGIPVDRRNIPKNNTYRAGKYIFSPRKRGADKLVGIVERTIDVPKRINFNRVITIGQRALPRLMEKALIKELVRSRLR